MNIAFNPISLRASVAPQSTSFKGKFDDMSSVYSEKYIGNNSYVILQDTRRGNPLGKGNIHSFKDYGVTNVVDMLNRKIDRKEDGVKFLSINMDSDDWDIDKPGYLLRPPFISKKDYIFDEKKLKKSKLSDKEIGAQYDKTSRDYVDNFVQFIQMMQEGNTLLCGYTELDTEYMLNMNKYFNPKADKIANRIPNAPDMVQVSAFRNLYKNLTDKDKEAMNWTKEFDKNFMKRLTSDETDSIYAYPRKSTYV